MELWFWWFCKFFFRFLHLTFATKMFYSIYFRFNRRFPCLAGLFQQSPGRRQENTPHGACFGLSEKDLNLLLQTSNQQNCELYQD